MTSVSRVCTSAWPGVSRRLAWILYASTSSSGFPLANAAATVLLSKNVMFAAGAIVLWARALPSGRAKPLTNKSQYTDRMTFAPFRSAVAGCGGERTGAHEGDGFVARGAGGAAHADRADDHAVDADRLAALERRLGHLEERGPPARDRVLQHLAGPLEQRRRAGFVDRDLGGGGERRLQALDVDQVAAVVHDGDRAALVVAPRVGCGGGRNGFGALEADRLLVGHLAPLAPLASGAPRGHGQHHGGQRQCLPCRHGRTPPVRV